LIHISEKAHLTPSPSGESERLVGKFIQQHNIPRSRIVILTKCFFGVVEGKNKDKHDPDSVNQHGLSRKHIFDAV